MDDALAAMARAVEASPLRDDEVDVLLDLARDVAHATERRFAPLSTFLAGVAVARAEDRGAALAAVAAKLRDAAVPPAAEG